VVVARTLNSLPLPADESTLASGLGRRKLPPGTVCCAYRVLTDQPSLKDMLASMKRSSCAAPAAMRPAMRGHHHRRHLAVLPTDGRCVRVARLCSRQEAPAPGYPILVNHQFRPDPSRSRDCSLLLLLLRLRLTPRITPQVVWYKNQYHLDAYRPCWPSVTPYPSPPARRAPRPALLHRVPFAVLGTPMASARASASLRWSSS